MFSPLSCLTCLRERRSHASPSHSCAGRCVCAVELDRKAAVTFVPGPLGQVDPLQEGGPEVLGVQGPHSDSPFSQYFLGKK